MTRRPRVVVIGAGIGGLTAALHLSSREVEVTVVESAAEAGGKMRRVKVAEGWQDAGPTVLTLPWIFERLFADAGHDFSQRVGLQPAAVLARHAWPDGSRLDLLADDECNLQAIETFSSAAEAARYRRFRRRARRLWETLDPAFLRRPQRGLTGLLRHAGAKGMLEILRARPFGSLWQALGRDFTDPRLRQLFGRYATYSGASPWQAPATLALIAHVEDAGVWLVEGGMHRLARSLATAATDNGARFHFGQKAKCLVVRRGRVAGVALADGSEVPADAVVFNGDIAALPAGGLGPEAVTALPGRAMGQRSLSAVTWNVLAETRGFPLSRHSVFFNEDYAAEFREIFGHGRIPQSGTVYVCAQDRAAGLEDAAPSSPERLLILINAPADQSSGHQAVSDDMLAALTNRTFRHLSRAGLHLKAADHVPRITTPADFDSLFPASGGALYGAACHGWRAAFRRPGSRSRLPGLYLAGGGVHPGPGVPMVALSGRLAADSILNDLGLTTPRQRLLMPQSGRDEGSLVVAGKARPSLINQPDQGV